MGGGGVRGVLGALGGEVLGVLGLTSAIRSPAGKLWSPNQAKKLRGAGGPLWGRERGSCPCHHRMGVEWDTR